MEGLLLAFCARLLLVAALLWARTPDTAFLWLAVEFLFVVTSVSVTRVATSLGTARSWLVLAVAHAARLWSRNIGAVISADLADSVQCL